MDLHAAVEWLQAVREADSPECIQLHYRLSKVNPEKWLKEHL